MAVTACDLRTYAKLPREVPEDFLEQHLAAALRDLKRDTGLAAAPTGLEAVWQEAQLAKAYALALPFLHVFAADGVARVGQLAGNVDFEFMDAKDALALADRQNDRYEALVNALKPLADGESEAVHGGSFTFIAI
jgi:hypothetical protein